MGKMIDITGKRFSKLVVKECAGRDKHGKAIWRCICDCGNENIIVGSDLRRGHTISCGHAKNLKHGMARTKNLHPLYKLWVGMKQRCTNPKATAYKDYGGRGIAVCERWRNSFENFLADMEERPEGTSLNRIDNDGGYSPDNCKWATKVEQGKNQRNNRMLTFEGRTMCLSEWARELDIDRKTIRDRLNRGWSMRKVLKVS